MTHRAAVRLFGELDVRLDDERLPPLESARARSLLAYLVLHGDAPQPRQRVAFLLWPESTEGQARTNLRHLLHTLRRRSPELDGFLDVTPQTLRWRKEAPQWVDVVAFESALGRADTADSAPDEALGALREAVGLYSGDLLDGCYDEWLVEARERLRDRYVAALRRLTDLLAERAERAEAIRLGHLLLRCDPLREDTYRLLMRVHDAAGDRAGAVRVYHECASTLQRELGVAPSPATTQAYATLINQAQPSTKPGREPEPVRARPPALVGRAREWAQLIDCWKDTERGHARLVLVTGEAGVGKTRLVEELAAWCEHRGAAVAQARSYRMEGELGFGVVIAWLRAGDISANLARLAPSDRTTLGRLLPEFADSSDATVPEALEEAEQRRRLFDAVARALLAAGRPTLLVADDAQSSDPQSLQLMHYLLRLEPNSRLLVVATARQEELDDEHPLVVLVGGLRMNDRVTEIALARLTPAATEKLARQLGWGGLGAAAVDDLYAETEGNPLFVVEAVRARWPGPRRDTVGLSPKLQAVIAARLRQLSAPARALVGIAATVGREFNGEVLGAVAGMDDVALVRGLDELWRRGIIREHAVDAYDFTHGKIRQVAYAALTPASRRRNHLLIADALASQARDADAVSGQIARHYDLGGHVDVAVRWYRRAAVQAQRLHANVEAVRLLDRARELVAALPEGGEGRDLELEILSALSTPLAVIEGFASTRLAQTQRRAAELAEAIGVDPEPRLLRSEVMSKLCRHDFGGARLVAGQLRSLAERADDDVLRIESDYLSGIAAFWDSAFESARQHFERVVDQFRPQGRTEHLLRFGHDPSVVCQSRLANTLWFLGRRDEAEAARDQAVAMASRTGHRFSRGVTYVFAALLCIDLGQTARYREYVDGLDADFQDHPWHDITTKAFRGYADTLEGRPGEGIRGIRLAIATPQRTDQSPGQRALLMRLLLAACDAAGDAESGLAAADDALALGGTRIWEAESRRLRAEFLAAQGAPQAEVEAELGLAAEVARRQGAVGPGRRIERSHANLVQRSDRPRKA